MDGVEQAAEKPIVQRDQILSPESFRAPTSPAERRLVPIWRNALNLDRIGVEDDFFALGGESMAAAVLCGEVERLVGRKVTPTVLLEASTIAAFAFAIDGDPRDLAARSLMELRPGTDRPPLVLIHGLDGQIMFARRLAWMLPPEQPLYGIQARGMDGEARPHTNSTELINDYADQIAAAVGKRDIYLGGFCVGGALAVGVSHRLAELGVTTRRLILIDPPISPRDRRRRQTPEAQRELLREWYDTLAERIAPYVKWHPEIAAHYAPGGAGLRRAQTVMYALLNAYRNYWPQPTKVPIEIIWSEERAANRGDDDTFDLAAGHCHQSILRQAGSHTVHKSFMQQMIREVADVVRRAIDLPPVTRRQPEGARGETQLVSPSAAS